MPNLGNHPRRVVIAGGGVGGLETALALRSLAGDRVDIELIAPERHFTYRPLSVSDPFGPSRTIQIEVAKIAAERGFRVTRDAIDHVIDDQHAVLTQDLRRVEYDDLVLALGARPRAALPGAVTFRGPRDAARVREALAEVAARTASPRVAFVSRTGTSWTLPLYELALLTSGWAQEREIDMRVSIITAERRPLEPFGAHAGDLVAGVLAERGITLHLSSVAASVDDLGVWIPMEGCIAADLVIALPILEGPAVRGLPTDALGFTPVDDFCHVPGTETVYAIGDMAARRVKQGGLAAQQADVAAASIAAAAGAAVRPEPYSPVLRGLLFTGGQPLYLRHPALVHEEIPADAGLTAPWWPAHKIVGRHLAPFLATHGEMLEPVPA
jgi:sulfide:quinone oxidoreductase